MKNNDKKVAITYEVRNSATGQAYPDRGVVKPRSLKGAIAFAEKMIAQHFDGDLLRGVDSMVLAGSEGGTLTLQEAILFRRAELENSAQEKMRTTKAPTLYSIRLVDGDLWEEDDEVCRYSLENAIEAAHVFLNGTKAGGLDYTMADIEIVDNEGAAVSLAAATAQLASGVAVVNTMATENQLAMNYLESLVGNHRTVRIGKKSRLSISRLAASCAARGLLSNWSTQLDCQSKNNLVQDVDAIVAVLKRLKKEARQLFSVENGGYGGKTLGYWEDALNNHGGVTLHEAVSLNGDRTWSFSHNGEVCDDHLVCSEREDLIVAAVRHFNLA